MINRLTPIKFLKKDDGGRPIWLFKCSCKDKTIKAIRLSHVSGNYIKSCGCIRRENGGKNGDSTLNMLII